MKRSLFVFLAVVFLSAPAHAQFGERDRLTIDMQPAFPEAFTPISLSLRSISLDLERATIIWYANGEIIAEGEAQKTASTVVGALGIKTTIVAEAIGPSGDVLTTTRVVQPAEVDLLWESDSYAPPFYAGKRLASSGSSVRVHALPRLIRADGTRTPASGIVFTWRRNDNVVTSVSGRGKSTAVFPGPDLFGADTISVEAASVDNALLAASTVLVPAVDPFVLLYQDHPLFGILLHRALGIDSEFADIEGSFAAVPFFAGVNSPKDPRLSYAWRVNGATIATDETDPSRLTINAQNSDGRARVELSLSHAQDYTMDTRGLWRLVFNSGLGASGVNLFGTPQ